MHEIGKKKETKKFVLEDFELYLSSSQINKTKIDGFKIDRSIEKKSRVGLKQTLKVALEHCNLDPFQKQNKDKRKLNNNSDKPFSFKLNALFFLQHTNQKIPNKISYYNWDNDINNQIRLNAFFIDIYRSYLAFECVWYEISRPLVI